MVKKRTLARELALKALYQYDVLEECAMDQLEEFCHEYGKSGTQTYAMRLVRGCIDNMEALDQLIESVAEHWQINRMAVIDRNLLRLGTYELIYVEDVPPKVTINEAIEMAKRFSTEQSGTFVNGVLDQVHEKFSPEHKRAEAPLAVPSELPPPPRAAQTSRADLHTHSTFSDGSLQPAELVDLAQRTELAAVALTDHDSVAGLPEAIRSAADLPLELVPGVEFTTYWTPAPGERPLEIHLLGLWCDAGNEWLTQQLEELKDARKRRIYQIADKLKEQGIEIDPVQLIVEARDTVGRAHVATELVAQGHCHSVDEAFERWLGFGRPAWVPKKTLAPAAVIRLIHIAGGVAVFAHPGLTERPRGALEVLLPGGLDGIEVSNPKHSEQEEARFRAWAREHGLAVSGGSDFHGVPKPEVELGSAGVTEEELEALRARRGGAPAKT